MGSRKKEVVKREKKRLPRETGGSFTADTQVWVRSTCSRAGLCSEGPGQPGGTANSKLMKFNKEKRPAPRQGEPMAATQAGDGLALLWGSSAVGALRVW